MPPMDRVSRAAKMQELTALKNIGASSAEKLLGAGIESREQIEDLGAVAVFLRLRRLYPVSMTMLWALQGALLIIPWYQLPEDMKAMLLAELRAAAAEQDAGRD